MFNGIVIVNICVNIVLYLIIACECILAGSAFPNSDTFESVVPISRIPVTYRLGTDDRVRLSFGLS